MTEEFYKKRINPIMYNYIKDKRYFQRNAAIAMGNLEDEAFILDLEMELNNPDEMIRDAVEWALQKIKAKYKMFWYVPANIITVELFTHTSKAVDMFPQT